jgi:hypothetical protein
MWRLLRGRGRVCLPRSRSSPSPWVGRGRDRRLRPGLSPSPGVGRSGVRRLQGLSPSPSPGVGRSGVRRLQGLSPSPSPGSGGAEFPMAPRARLGCCKPHSIEWHSSRSGVGGAVLLSDRSVERRSDCGHFGSVDRRARVRIKVLDHLCIKCSCDLVGWRGDLARVASWRRLGLRRAGSMFVAGGGPRARRRSSGVGCSCPRLGSGEA